MGGGSRCVLAQPEMEGQRSRLV